MRAKSRYRSTGWGKFVLGLVVLSWGTASAGPCLMAADAAAVKPVAVQHDGHAGHHAAAATGHDCDHCPPGGAHAAALCDAGFAPACGAPIEASADSRKPELKWQGGAQVLAPPPNLAGALDSGRHASIPTDDPGLMRRSTGPSLSIRYCVFLK